MEIEYRKGCLIKAVENEEVGAFAHGANCFNTMKSGIAPLITKAFPQMETADLETEKGDLNKLGTVTYAWTDLGTLGFNVYSQYKYGYNKNSVYANYEAIQKAFSTINTIIKFHNKMSGGTITEIGLPKLGAGKAQGDWLTIAKIISRNLTDVQPVVYLID
jgi:O-acetyl-ADP-ribose deacetylase (regulator of RNase III)